ncbi:MarR family transcriptional regulator [Corynebacterium sp. CNJ-954]|uniref:MarR family winged helix-turn-helix transcriptional regulator n=1 Tax=Corynebacterium sp. CNJ-954 TaxID=1904962 RepID=UPI00095C2A97|nr:MarR family transcriptional regulator [Corynebacterium sp. CNJ-954]OLT51853.1 MarR family transcriptional regulator [Corynebacterium sp. CNJ-954]
MAETFDRTELETWASLATLLEWLPAALDEQMQRDSGISHFEYGILYALSQAEDSTLRMSRLADYANSTLSRLSRAVARLEKRDWVRRIPDPSDGRVTVAILTAAGQNAVRAAEPGHVALVRRLVFDSLTDTQVSQLSEITRRITGALREDQGWRPRSSGGVSA